MGTKKTFALTAILGLVLLLFSTVACKSDDFKGWTQGKFLYLYVPNNAQVVDQVAYLDQNGDHFVVKPAQPGNMLAVLNVTVVNPKSARVILTMSDDSASISDPRGNKYDMMDPFKNSTKMSAADPNEGKFSPFLWGSVELVKDYQVQGWLVYEVPGNFKPAVLLWEESESIRAQLTP